MNKRIGEEFNYLDHSTTKISYDIYRSAGELKRLAVTQIPGKNHTAVKNFLKVQ